MVLISPLRYPFLCITGSLCVVNECLVNSWNLELCSDRKSRNHSDISNKIQTCNPWNILFDLVTVIFMSRPRISVMRKKKNSKPEKIPYIHTTNVCKAGNVSSTDHVSDTKREMTRQIQLLWFMENRIKYENQFKCYACKDVISALTLC